MTKKLFLIDAMGLIYRAYYAMARTPRITSQGVNTSALFGFTNSLFEVLQKEKPTHIAVAFDTHSPTVRHVDFAAYKANRQATPEDIISSVPQIKNLLEAWNIPTIEKDGYEADDIIGTLAKQAEIAGFDVYMMTSDKDYGQLVSDHIFMYKPAKYGNPTEVVNVAKICEKYAINTPEQLIDILGLMGDASDNIPGVPNIGEVKAKKLIGQFGSIENIYQNIQSVENDKTRQTLIDNQAQAMMSKMLATIILDVPIEVDIETMTYQEPNISRLQDFFQEWEFKTLGTRILNSLDKIGGSPPSIKTAPAHPQQLPDLFSELTVENMYAPDHRYDSFTRFQEKQHDFNLLTSSSLDSFFIPREPLAFELICSKNDVKGFMIGKGETFEYLLSEKEPQLFEDLLKKVMCSGQTLITYSCKSIYKFLRLLGIDPQVSIYDLQIAHYLIQPENSHELGRLCEHYLNYSLLETDNSLEDAINNAGEKTEVYVALYPDIQKELKGVEGETLFQKLEMPLAEVLANMEYDGVFIDKNMLQEISQEITEYIQQLEKHIFEYAGEHFNIASPKQIGEILFGKMQIIANAKLTKSKQYQTGEEVLNKLVNKHPIIPLILDWRKMAKLKSTYLDALPQLISPQTGRVHTTYTQTVTSTGRLSSVNPNLQNIPIRTEQGREIRKAFSAPDQQTVIMAADYSQIELRIVASICGDENMIASFKTGKDIHAAMAAIIYHIEEHKVTSEMRRNAKTVNFGILYGMSSYGLSDRLHISTKDSADLITRYFNSFPNINQYLEETKVFAREKGYVETLFGRRRYIRDINSQNGMMRKAAERNAINAPIQGTAADLIKVAMNDLFKEMKEQKVKSKMIMQVHDELVFEVPLDEVEMMQQLITDKMQNAIKLNVPIEVNIQYGKNWFEAH